MPTLLTAGNHCVWYMNSKATYFPGYGLLCAYTGGGCMECWSDDGGTCVMDGFAVCIPGHPFNQNP